MSLPIPKGRLTDLEFIRQVVRERSAIVLDEDKDYLIEARLEPLAKTEGFESMTRLIASLRAPSAPETLFNKVIDAMTTNETSFFRDMIPFDCLKSHVLPQIVPSREDRKALRLWCGASSSGQEPYSILFLIKESFPELLSWKLRMLATDISPTMVERTRTGLYTQLEANRGLPAKMLVSNFSRKGVKWQVKDEIRTLVDAREVNLIGQWPALPEMDIIFLRNVLIYFDVETKAKILAKLKSVLAPDGFLFLGGAETTVGIDDDFERVDFPSASCYRLKRSG